MTINNYSLLHQQSIQILAKPINLSVFIGVYLRSEPAEFVIRKGRLTKRADEFYYIKMQ